ncbi:MAG TPA: histidine kinase [Chitinophagaceae bacterium]
MRTLFAKYNLRIGLILAIVFPGVFAFAQPNADLLQIIQRFLPFFAFILIIWILNYEVISFTAFMREKTNSARIRLYSRILIISIISVPLYFVLAFLFRQEDVMLSSLYESNFSAKAWFFICLRIMLFNAGIMLSKYLSDSHRENQRILLENETLKREHIHAIHESLKQQVDPHFLFNSLNTLQSLVKQDSAQSLLFISELSAVYRYMLDRRDRNYVTIRDEIEFLKSYLYLLKIRFGEAIQTRIQVGDDVMKCLIPPHTLQLLAENAVKHNKLSTRKPLLFEIRTDEDFLIVTNNIAARPGSIIASGVGLKNISNRFRLLFGKNVRIERKSDEFTVFLPLINADEYPDYRGRGADSLGPETNTAAIAP